MKTALNIARLRIAVLGAAVVLCPAALFGQMDPTPTAPSATPSLPGNHSSQNQQQDSTGSPELTGQEMKDKAFVRKASEGSMAEVEFGQLALQKTANGDVKQFAQKMVDDHTMLMSNMQPVAEALGMRMAKKINKADQAEYDKLGALSGPDFDKEYLTFMVADHHKDLREFRMEAVSAADPGLKDAAVKGERVIREHTRMVDQLATANGISVPARRMPPMAAPTN